VLSDKTPAMPSKKGTRFSIFKMTDLVKYDLNKVQKHFESSKCGPQETKLQMKQFTPNGYKQVSFMAFGNEVSISIQNIKAGCVIMVINPKLMKSKDDDKNGVTFTIDSEA
jgi:hypothetical protein